MLKLAILLCAALYASVANAQIWSDYLETDGNRIIYSISNLQWDWEDRKADNNDTNIGTNFTDRAAAFLDDIISTNEQRFKDAKAKNSPCADKEQSFNDKIYEFVETVAQPCIFRVIDDTQASESKINLTVSNIFTELKSMNRQVYNISRTAADLESSSELISTMLAAEAKAQWESSKSLIAWTAQKNDVANLALSIDDKFDSCSNTTELAKIIQTFSTEFDKCNAPPLP